MARAYVDLLTFPMGSGGRDTYSRLVWIGAELGYSAIGIYTTKVGVDLSRHELPGTKAFAVAREGSKAAARASIRIATGKRARMAASRGNVDFIVPDPMDKIAIRFAAENQVAVAYPYSYLLKEHATRKSNLLRLWLAMHRNCVKHGCRELLVSAAEDSYLMRDPRDLAAMMCSCLDVSPEESLDWVSSTPLEILRIAEERRRG